MTIAQSPRSDKFPAEITALRLQLHQNGFEPLPAYGKTPVIKRWPLPHNDKQIRRLGWDDNEIKAWAHRLGWDDAEIRCWAEVHHRATNTVFDAKFAPALVIDTSIGPAAEAAEKVAREYFEKRG